MDSSTQIERTAAAWLARRDSGTWTEADQAELDAWLGASTAHRVAWLRLNAAWQQSDRLKALGAGLPPGQVPPRGEWTLSPFFGSATRSSDSLPPARGGEGGGNGEHRSRPTPGHRTDANETAGQAPIDLHDFAFRRRVQGTPRRRFGAVAASLALTAALALGWWQFGAVERASYATAVGDLRTAEMPDGSQATLSSGSRIDVTVSRRERRVTLQQGEVYFDVTKDPRRPFVVQAGERRVVVVGTHFSVRSDDNGELRVVVTEGRVRLEPGTRTPHRPTLLSAGMVALAGKDGVRIQAHPLEKAEELLSWRNGFLTFRDTPLAEAVAEFNRYNAQQLVIHDPAIAAIPIGGNFRWSNTDAFVRLLERGFALRAERRGDEIVLRGQ